MEENTVETNQIPEQGNLQIQENLNLLPEPKKSKKATFIMLAIILVLIIAGIYYTEKIYLKILEVIKNSHSEINSRVLDITKMTGNSIKSSGDVVLLKTNMGDIKIELYDDMPITTGNFKSLAEKGTYNGVIFHRAIEGFMIQGGDPTGTGYGDPKIPKIKDEFTHAEGNKNNRGTISMANAGPNTGSSQFFINLVNNNFLDSKHPAFGEVIEGMDVVDKIAKVQTNANDRPLKEVKIIEARLV